MKDATIIYYSSNKEDWLFENKVIDNLINMCGNLPIVSVTQKPTRLGKNICVGDVGASGFNCFRQIQIACQNAKTKYVISAEADCLYPPDYFILPEDLEDNKCYRNSNLYVMPDLRDYFFYKEEGATHSQIVNREFYLKTLNELFKDCPEWNENEKNFPKERYKKEDIFKRDEIIHYKTKNPVFQVKTHKGMRYYTHSDRTPIATIPYWGSGKEWRKYLIKNEVKPKCYGN